MKGLTYQKYAADEAVRQELEREVRRLRAETVQAGLRALKRALFGGVSVVNRGGSPRPSASPGWRSAPG